jgi:uncharacterized protein YhbP (UPF0306 family)
LSYTQPPPLTEDEIDNFLKEQKVAKICSLNKDGTIHTTAIWFLYKNGLIIMLTPAATRKARNIIRNDNVTVFVDDDETARGVLIFGKAKLEYEYSFRDSMSLYEKYMPLRQAARFAREMSNVSKGGAVMITVRPERIVSFDKTKDTVLRINPQEF